MIDRLRRSPLLAHRINRLGRTRAQRLVHQMAPYLTPGDRILDLGCGTCHVADALIANGHGRPTLLDVEDFSFVESLTPQLYDGAVIPFEDKRFDVVLLVTVLHHTREPERLIVEAARVANRLIVIEDVYGSFIGRIATNVMDSVSNLEFFGHPHANRSDREWRACFRKLGLALLDARYSRFWKLFTSAVYALGTPRAPGRVGA